MLKATVRASRATLVTMPAIPLPENEQIVRTLLTAGFYEAALHELQYARHVWGDSPAIQATVAWVNQQMSRDESGMPRFQLLRGAMNSMKRAYPQYMTVEGNELPRDVQTVIFPIAYWELIKKHATANGIDPYLMAALVSQESTFVADIRSPANAYGLTQLLPGTARQYAQKVNISYSTRVLTDPEANLRIGTRYFAEIVQRMGAVHLALASYNAGERPVRQWLAAKSDLPVDEFIDDIPYPETQQYVRKIMGTAEDYRRLYGDGTVIDSLLDKTPTRIAMAPATPAAPVATSPAPAKAPAKAAPAKKAPTPKPMPTAKPRKK
jgi:soluble lytic murein transglycosylase